VIRLDVVRTIFVNTLQKELRSRTLLYFFVATIVVMILAGGFLEFISRFGSQAGGGLDATKRLTFFYNISSTWNALMTVVMAFSLVKTDADYNVLGLILSKPIRRLEYLIGRISALFAVILGYYLFCMILASIYFGVSAGMVPVVGGLLLSLMISGLAILIYIFYALLMWLLLGSQGFFGAFMVLLLLAVVSLADDYGARYWVEGVKGELPPAVVGVMSFLYFIFPRTGTLQALSREALKSSIDWTRVPWELGHYVVTASLFFVLIHFVFKRKEIP